MKEDPLVSILMPVYNAEKFLREAIESVLNQSYKNFELILINDGSTDNTQKIIDSYHDPRIKKFNQDNMGVSRSLNRGIDLAKGEYIRRHDADDISRPNMLETQVNFLKENPSIDFVSTQIAFMSPNSKISKKYRQPKNHYFGNDEHKLVKIEDFNPYSPIVHGTVLGPTKRFKEMNGYRTEFLTAEDNDLWLRIIEKYNFAVLNTCPYAVRLSNNSATQMHGSSLNHYRDLTIEYAKQRAELGSDPIMRDEKIQPPEKSKPIHKLAFGKNVRKDLLEYKYKIMIDAKDFKESLRIILYSIKDGHLAYETYKLILLPIIPTIVISYLRKIKRDK